MNGALTDSVDRIPLLRVGKRGRTLLSLDAVDRFEIEDTKKGNVRLVVIDTSDKRHFVAQAKTETEVIEAAGLISGESLKSTLASIEREHRAERLSILSMLDGHASRVQFLVNEYAPVDADGIFTFPDGTEWGAEPDALEARRHREAVVKSELPDHLGSFEEHVGT
jgi:hypothetical protein